MSGPAEFGTYLVYEELGSGAMASVHRAETRGAAGFRKAIALKRLHPQLAANEELVRAFVNEARLASHLKHGNIVQTFDFGKVDDTYFIAMELARGPTLKQLIRQCVSAAGAMPLPIAIGVVIQICDALDHAHNVSDEHGKPLGIVHRDVSPSNVIIDSSGIVKLIDFGIAKVKSRNIQTQAGTIKGKFGYIAPEYLAGQIDARADLFAVGVLTHELLTSRQLFTAENEWETLSKIREMPIQPPSRWNPSVPTELDHIVLTALQRDPSLRWQNAAALRNALTGVLRELNEVVTDKRVADWVMWAFSQMPRNDDSAMVRLIDQLEPSVSVEIIHNSPNPPDEAPAASAPASASKPVASTSKASKSTSKPPKATAEPQKVKPAKSKSKTVASTSKAPASTSNAPASTSKAPASRESQEPTILRDSPSFGIPHELPKSISDATIELVPTTVRPNPLSIPMLFPETGRPSVPSPRAIADAMLSNAPDVPGLSKFPMAPASAGAAPGTQSVAHDAPVPLKSLSSRLAAEQPDSSKISTAPASSTAAQDAPRDAEPGPPPAGPPPIPRAAASKPPPIPGGASAGPSKDRPIRAERTDDRSSSGPVSSRIPAAGPASSRMPAVDPTSSGTPAGPPSEHMAAPTSARMAATTDSPSTGVVTTPNVSQSSGVVLEHKLPVKRPFAPRRRIVRAWLVVLLLLVIGGGVAAYFMFPELTAWWIARVP